MGLAEPNEPMLTKPLAYMHDWTFGERKTEENKEGSKCGVGDDKTKLSMWAGKEMGALNYCIVLNEDIQKTAK